MLKGKSFLKLLDFTTEELQYLLDLAKKLKIDKKNGTEKKTMVGKNIALIFEKTSTRTRCAFEVGAYDQGANVTYIGPSASQIGDKESMEDTAKVLGRFYDGIEYRGYGQDLVETLAEHSGVPVWNGLTTEFHPTQILADFLTITEKKGKLKGIKFAKEYFPEEKLVEEAKKIAEKTGGKILLTEDKIEGVKDADVVYTDVWVSMGEPKEIWKERIDKLLPYQVNADLVKHCSNDYLFMHCLPAFHDLNTKVAKNIEKEYGLKEMEVTDEVFRSKNSVVFDEAENRMHTIKAVMVATLGEGEYPL